MGKRATRGKRGRSAVAKQKRWDKLTSKHVEQFINNVIQDGADARPSAGNYCEEVRQETLLQNNDWIRKDLLSCYFDEDGIIHAQSTSHLASLPRHIIDIAYNYAAYDDRSPKSLTCSEGSRGVSSQDDNQDAAKSDNECDPGQSPLARSPTPFDETCEVFAVTVASQVLNIMPSAPHASSVCKQFALSLCCDRSRLLNAIR